MKWLTGNLDPYWEQGMEGAFLYAVALPQATGPYTLQEGDLLDILAVDKTLLWSGTFQLRKRRFWERHMLKKGVWANSTQRGVSYGQWMEWFWAQPPLSARVLRPTEGGNILYPKIDRHSNRPGRLRDLSEARVVGRRVLQWSSHRGTYGMGGPGFFGLELEAKDDHPQEWLVLTIWGAASWLLLDGRWIEAHPKFYDIQNLSSPTLVATRIGTRSQPS